MKEHIEFDETLKISEASDLVSQSLRKGIFNTSDNKETEYRLFSVVEHIG